MIKKFALNKIIFSSLCLLLFALFYFFPTHENINYEIVSDNNKEKNIVYLLDEDNYISRVISYFDSKTIEEEIVNKINILINGLSEYDNFYPLIPKDTKLNSIKVDKDSVYLDFSKEILSINSYLEESMLESIVYSLTEINGINNIYISVDGKRLDKLPFSNKIINYPLTRNIGINKEYNINNLNNLYKTTVYFLKDNNDISYYVPVTLVNNSNEEKVELIINELKSSINSQNNLKSFLTDKVKLLNYEIENDNISLVFNEQIKNVEEYLIASSIFENYKVNKVTFKSDSKTNVINKSDLKKLDF